MLHCIVPAAVFCAARSVNAQQVPAAAAVCSAAQEQLAAATGRLVGGAVTSTAYLQAALLVPCHLAAGGAFAHQVRLLVAADRRPADWRAAGDACSCMSTDSTPTCTSAQQLVYTATSVHTHPYITAGCIHLPA